ncbi:hypothetical protein BJF78_30810 [Pseudonocardia sp. CNS-139]|nr:hypothetical protein BJF78_30810 [Pseudonocardia sp. CNS-139]
MRKSVIVLSVMTVAGLGTAGTAVAEPPEPAEGIAVALFGTTAGGEAVPVSQPLVDPALGTCFDLLTPDGRAATWGEFVNRTDRVAAISTGTCGEVDGHTTALRTLAPGAAGSGYAWRSVRFTSIP